MQTTTKWEDLKVRELSDLSDEEIEMIDEGMISLEDVIRVV
jgi:hypothetical protein